LFGILKMKALIFGLLLASPPVAAWMMRADSPAVETQGIQAVSHTVPAVPASESVQIPIEVVTKGSAPKTIYVQVSNQSVPEPGVVSLLALTSLLLLRRQRVK
jgi:hypothetical protein